MHDKLLWFNNDILYMFHSNIVEYDIVASSLSISEQFKLLPQDLIDELKLLPKEQRTRRIGLIQRDDKVFSKTFLSKEIEVRKHFIEINKLDETNILSLHSDAVLFSSRKRIKTNVDNIEFKHKHSWSSYLRFDGVEMFYSDGSITYKNIPTERLQNHTLGINLYLCRVFEMIDNYDSNVLDYISQFEKDYLCDKLPEYYYNAFSRNGTYKFANLKLFAFIANTVLNEMRDW